MVVRVSDDALAIELIDGRMLTVPIVWFPRLSYGTVAERSNHRLTGTEPGSTGQTSTRTSRCSTCWGRKSGESQRSLQRWLNERASKSSHRT